MQRNLVKMSDLIQEISMGPFGSDIKVDNFIKSGIPVLDGANISGIKLIENKFKYVTVEKAKSLKKANARRGDIVITHRGTLGQICYIPDNSRHQNYIISQSQFRVTLKTELVDPEYLVYYFHTSEGQKRLLANKCHVGVPALAQATTNFRLIEVPLPTLESQKKITSVLSVLDEKIELNNRINAELEAMAKTLYDYWFVQFDFPDENGNPYRSSGGKMVYSTALKREIPKGWEISTFSTLATTNPYEKLVKGSTASFVDMKAIPETGSCIADILQKIVSSGPKFRNNDVLLARITPCLENGKTALVQGLPPNAVGHGSTEFIVLRSKYDGAEGLIYLIARDKDFRNYCVSSMTGTSGRQRIAAAQVIAYKMPIPPENIVMDFARQTTNMFQKIGLSHAENQQLTKLRDWLLPMLMNGQITVQYMSSSKAAKKINLVTLPGQNGETLSFEKALGALARLLMEAPLRELVQALAEISSMLYEKSSAEAESYLRGRFCSKKTIEAICPLDDEETVNYLFPYNALYVLNTLLTFNIKLTTQESYVRIFNVSERMTSSVNSQQNATLPIAEIFLLANQLILYLEKNLEGVAFAYSRNRVQEDVFTALSKAKNLYDVPYFNEQFMHRFGYTISQWEVYQFMLLTAVKVHKPAKIELGVSFNKMKDDVDRSRVENLVKLLTLEAKGTNATLDEVTQALQEDFVLDNRCRGKPFLKIGQRYICIRHDLLISSTDNFPYHHLFSMMTEDEKEVLFKEFGDAFEKRYIPMISSKVLGQRIESYTYKRKPHRGNKVEDLYVSVTDQAKLILEIKSGRANDAVKIGTKQDLIEKYIRLKSSSGNPKGIVQALKQASNLRNEGFSGEIFTGIVFYNLPFNGEFDQLIAQEIEPMKEHQEYRKYPLNHPPIWLDVIAYELLLIAVQQGVSLYKILKKLSALPPSETRHAIVGIIREAGLEISIHPLYSEAIKELQERCKSMLIPEPAAAL